jgi:hypothetical protein
MAHFRIPILIEWKHNWVNGNFSGILGNEAKSQRHYCRQNLLCPHHAFTTTLGVVAPLRIPFIGMFGKIS